MNKKMSSMLVLAVILIATAFGIAGEKPWLDMQNCEFCKPWLANGLMKEMTHEQLPISNGVVCVSSVPEKRFAEYKKTSEMMNEIGKRAAAGEKIQMCGSCEAMGSFFMRGAKMEEVWTKNGSIMLLTSTDPAIVAEMHKWAQKNDEEFDKMMSAKPTK